MSATTVEDVRSDGLSEFARHSALVFGSTVVVSACNYLFHFIISRKLGVVGYGNLYSVLTVTTLFGVLTLVASTVIVRLAAHLHAVGDRAQTAELARLALQRSLLGALALSIIGFVAAPAAAAYLQISDPWVVIAGVLVVAVGLVSPAVRGVLQGMQDFVAYAISVSIESLGKVLLGVGAAFMGWGAAGALGGVAAGTVLSIIYSRLALHRHFTGLAPHRLELHAATFWRSSIAIGVAMLAMTTLSATDVVLVKHYFAPADAGLYSAVSLVGKILLFAVGFVPTLMLPKATARTAVGESARGVIVRGLVLTLAITAAGILVLALAPAFAIRVMAGNAFVAGAVYALPYGVAMALLGIVNVVVAYLIALQRFAFVPGLMVVAIGEVLAIVRWHSDIETVIRIVIAAGALALVAVLAGGYRWSKPAAR